MSYCRWSSDNFKSDVYAYEHYDGGFCIHVRRSKLMFPAIPDFPIMRMPKFGAKLSVEGDWRSGYVYPSRLHKLVHKAAFRIYAAWHNLHMWSVKVMPRKAIDLPHDGETLWADDAAGCAKLLEELAQIGYHVPKYAIELLKEEAQDEQNR